MATFITIIKWLKDIFLLFFGFALIIFSVFSYITGKGEFTPSNPQEFLISYIRFYDERVLIFFILAGGALIFYSFHELYVDYYNSTHDGTDAD
jgi:hypothetical protein